jgi:peptidoglycan/LPS O-acetylase OafA/YrhL
MTARDKKSEHDERDLPVSISLLLDILRFAAALAVVFNHACFGRFQMGFPPSPIESALGDLAVPVFFVMSGFVIRYVTCTRESTPRTYAINRLSRIYSAVVPALLITIVVVVACYCLNRELYASDLHPAINHLGVRFTANLLFFSQFWGHSIIPFDNIPLWSLGYECPYYVLYASLFFLRGWKRIAAVLPLTLLVGPQILLLLPIWWAGCWVYDLYRRIRGTAIAPAICVAVALWVFVAGLLAGLGHTAALTAPLRGLEWVANLPNPLSMAGLQERKASMMFLALGIGTAVSLFLLLLVFDFIHLHPETIWLRRVRHVADGTFVVYVLHYPLLTLALYLNLFHPGHYIHNIFVVAAIVFLLVLLARPVDLLKTKMRLWLHRYLPRGVDAVSQPDR